MQLHFEAADRRTTSRPIFMARTPVLTVQDKKLSAD